MPGRALRLAQRLTRTTIRRIPRSRRDSYVPGLVSVIVPAYNVEAFLGECLDSLLSQTYPSVEVILVVDGATDRTVDIAERYAAENPSVILRVQQNRGLSAARNVGVTLASGEYLCFVDSDDRVAPHAYELMVGRLVETGSDFVVARYRRFNNTRTWAAAPWIRRAHARSRSGVTIRTFPDIQVNAVAWSKLYRRSFWDAAKLSFEEGVTYEDQATSAKAYALARAFDVLPDTLFDWRDREDGSSISQRQGTAADLAARVAAGRASFAVLRDAGLHEAVRVRALQLLCNDFPQSIARVPGSDDQFWGILREFLLEAVAEMPPDGWRQIPGQHAAAIWLVVRGLRDKLEHYLAARANDASTLECWLLDGAPAVKAPFWNDQEVAYPPDALKLSDHQLALNTSLRGAHWEGEVLVLDGWAYIAGINLADNPFSLELTLVSKAQEIPLVVEPRPDKDVDRVTQHEWNDYRPGGFRAYAGLDQIRERGAYRLRARLTAAGVSRTGWVGRPFRGGSLTSQQARTCSTGLRVRLDATGTITVRARKLRHHVASVDRTTDGVLLRLGPTAPDHVTQLILSASDETWPTQRIDPTADDPHFALDAAALAHLQRGWWTVRGLTQSGRTVEIDWPEPVDDPLGMAIGGRVFLRRTQSGNLGIYVYGLAALVIGTCSLTERGLELSGDGFRARDTVVRLSLSDHRARVDSEVVWDGGRWTAVLPLVKPRWRFGPGPLPIGHYRLSGDTDGGRSVGLRESESLLAQLPLRLEDSAVTARIEKAPQGSLEVLLLSPAPEHSKGARAQRQLRTRHQRHEYPPLREAVLFRSYYGELATCNALGIHQELVRRGSDLQLVWAVKDRSIPVPEGGIGVVTTSPDWYEALSTARYVIDNMHQPEYFEKRPGQVVTATFHGYPFKNAGLRHWRQFGVSPLRIESYLRRHRQWDFLLSPAPYATPLLAEVFPSDAEILEIGYPRNDVFFRNDRSVLRTQVRRSLGIADDVTAVLYAPTFRDNVTVSETQARMVSFVDFNRAAADLGSGHVILVRGHAFNRRLSERVPGDAGVIDVTDYPEITDLCLASDMAVLDYSSLRFDYSLTGNPMVFLVPDLDAYRDDMRGVLVPFEATAPGPLVATWREATEWITNPSELKRSYADARERFRLEYTPLEDGRAGARFVDRVFG